MTNHNAAVPPLVADDEFVFSFENNLKTFVIDKEEVLNELAKPWCKALDSVFKKLDIPPNFVGGTFGESTTQCLIKIMKFLVKYCGMNSDSVFLDVGGGRWKPCLFATQISNGPRIAIGVEICASKTHVRIYYLCKNLFDRVLKFS